jgi:hypothetical protein
MPCSFPVLLLLPTPTIPPVLHCAARYSRLCCNFSLRGPIIRAVLQLTPRRGCCRGGKRGGRPRNTTASAPEASTNVGQVGVARALCASYASSCRFVHCYGTKFEELFRGELGGGKVDLGNMFVVFVTTADVAAAPAWKQKQKWVTRDNTETRAMDQVRQFVLVLPDNFDQVK